MFTQTIKIDRAGRITLPRPIREALGLPPAHEAEVVIELTEAGAMIKPTYLPTPITERIGVMGLPVADWEQIEEGVEVERSNLWQH
jgi:bifunctional DNA-binding transcriptional regulator/antitoxin component of YhaV-PrlF toxin-antitoxin module